MEIPQKDLGGWADELVTTCNVSQQKRISDAMYYRSYYLDGCTPGDQTTLFNKVYAHIDALSSALYSPAEVRFWIEVDDPEVTHRAEIISNILTQEFHNSRVALSFANTLPWSLVYGKAFTKLGWHGHGLKSWSVMPYELGVYDESRENLDDQEAIVHTYYLSKWEVYRRIKGHPKEAELKRRLTAYMSNKDRDDGYHKVFMGGLQPIITQGAPRAAGVVSIRPNAPMADISPQTSADLIKMHEIWAWDDEREDWTTIQCAAGGTVILEGELKRRNLFIKGHNPFSEICPNPINGYFWGLSEISPLTRLQDSLNEQNMNILKLLSRQVRRNRAFVGFTGLTEEKVTALNKDDGWISETDATGKIEDLTPKLPPELFAAVHEYERMFDDMAGFTPTLQGHGEAGVRSAQQAETLVRMSTPRLRDRALLCEHQVGELGDLCLKVMQAHMSDIHKTESGEEFYLKSLPEDYQIQLDAHSSSPVFIEDSMRHALILKQQGAIDEEGFLRLTHPPMYMTLMASLRKRKAAQAKLMEELKRDHPELLLKQMQHHKGK